MDTPSFISAQPLPPLDSRTPFSKVVGRASGVGRCRRGLAEHGVKVEEVRLGGAALGKPTPAAPDSAGSARRT